MVTIYGVTSGSYSGYSVLGMFESRELAEAALPLYGLVHGECRVEEFGVVESLDEIRPVLVHFATVDEIGREESRSMYHAPEDVGEICSRVSDVNVIKEWNREWYDAIDRPHPWENTRLGKQAWATSLRSQEEALKAARDKMAQFKAEEAGIA
jgi:hypothetical protein